MSMRIFIILIVLSAINAVNALHAKYTLKAQPFNEATQCLAPWINLTTSTKGTEQPQPYTTAHVYTKRADPFTKSYMKRTFNAYLDLSITYFILVSVLHVSPSTYMTIQLAMLWVECDDIRALLALANNK